MVVSERDFSFLEGLPPPFFFPRFLGDVFFSSCCSSPVKAIHYTKKVMQE